MKNKSSKYCPNCYYPLTYKAKFCAHCGQKSSSSPVSMRSLLKDIWFRVLHLESRSLRFLWRLFIPGLLTQEFFSGKQKRYPPPVRFFFLMTFFFLFTLNHVARTGGLHIRVTQSNMALTDSSGGKPFSFYETAREFVEVTRMRQAFDSLPESFRTPHARMVLDSLFRQVHGEAVDRLSRMMAEAEKAEPGNGNSLDSLNINVGLRHIKVAMLDIYQLDPEEIIQKYGIHHWIDKAMVRQGIKSLKEPEALVKTYLGNLAWTILALVALMSGVLTLLYWKQHRYYVEHFILLLNEHSNLFLSLTVIIWINYLLHLPVWTWIVVVLWLLFGPYLAFRRFYGQTRFQTFIKWFIYSICYLAGFVLLFIVGLLLVFFIF